LQRVDEENKMVGVLYSIVESKDGNDFYSMMEVGFCWASSIDGMVLEFCTGLHRKIGFCKIQ
jgi:hypothetical protein